MGGWGVGKYEDMCREIHGWGVDVLGVTETKLREHIENENHLYRYVGKGRSKWTMSGGGIGFLIRKSANIDFQELDVNGGKEGEDIMAGFLEYKSGKTMKKNTHNQCLYDY